MFPDSFTNALIETLTADCLEVVVFVLASLLHPFGPPSLCHGA